MPTPFTHLEIAQRLLDDPQLDSSIRAALNAERSAFLLGSIAADARVSSGLQRENTHFYNYNHPISEAPWRVMLRQYPDLIDSVDAQRAFVAGYVAHLVVDEIWSEEMVRPQFANREWGTRQQRFLMLHIILIYMDERDYSRLLDWQRPTLAEALPAGWLPFINDDDLRTWRDFVANQLPPGLSETLNVFGGRINREPTELRSILDAPDMMEDQLWENIAPPLLAEVENRMYTQAREMLACYWNGHV